MNRRTTICACAAAAVLSAAAYLAVENNALMLTEYEYRADSVSAELDGFRIVHLSDVHGKRFGKGNSRLIKLVSEQSPDIIVISGDLVDSRRPDPEAAYELVGGLAPIAPVYYVTGNHEERLPRELYISVMENLSSLGAHILDGNAETVTVGSSEVNIAGFRDSRYFTVSEAKELVLSGAFNILINHRPQYAAGYAEAGFDLAFSGHAHGGQIRLPFIGGVIAPDQYLFPKYYEGVHRFAGGATVISRGLGNSLLPLRVNNRPEVVSVTLRKG